MAYEVCQTCLLLPVDLTRSECASWVQAIGSILAIGASFLVVKRSVLYQVNQANLSMAAALLELAKGALKLQLHFQSILSKPDDVHKAGEDGLPFDIAILRGLERSLNAIEVHKLPATLVPLGMILPASITQLRIKIEMALRHHREMDAHAFDDFFKTLNEMITSLQKTIVELEKATQIISKT